MPFYLELVAGFVLAHVIWALFYCVGTLIMTSIAGFAAAPPLRRHIIEGLVRTGCGAAAFMFAIFLLGAVGELNATALIALTVAMPAVLFAVSARRAGVRGTLHELAAPWAKLDVFAAAVYSVAVLCFAPALLAPVEWDSGMYHLAHAVDWARAGRIYVDPYVRYPLFSYNIELLYASLFALGLRFYVQVIDWLAFAWSALAVYAFTLYLVAPKLKGSIDGNNQTQRRPYGAALVAFVAAAVYCSSPIVLRYVDTAYVDIPIGFFFIATIAAAVLAIERDRAYAFAAAAIGGSLIGMKLPLFAFIPLVVLILAYVGAVTGSKRRRVAGWIGTFAVAGAPWYVRNVLVAGDPISPILNMALKRSDPFWSPQDYLGVMGALQGVREPPLLAPILQFMHPDVFGEFGASLSVCFMLLPVLVVLVMLLSRQLRSGERPFFVACASTAYAVCAIYLVSNYIGRYVIEFYAAYVSVLAAMIVSLTVTVVHKISPRASMRVVATGATCVLALTAIPSPASTEAFRGITSRYENIGANVTHPARYFSSVSGYRDVVDVSSVINASGKHGTVLELGLENLAYVFRDQGVVSIGDWFGPARWSDLQESTDTSAVAAYLRRFDVAAVIVARNVGFTDAERTAFLRQVKAAGYLPIPGSGSAVRSFVRPDVLKAAFAGGYRSELATAAPRGSSLQFIDVFARGTINADRPVSTPTGRGVLVFPWPSEDRPYNTITVVSGYAYTFGKVRLGAHPTLLVDVSKPLSEGRNAWAWVDITPAGGKRVRLLSAICRPADGNQPYWQHLALKVPFRDVDVSVTFGTSSFPGGGIADWVAFAHPVLEDSVMR